MHDSQKEQDAEREKVLTQNGFRVIRFTNEQVENNLEEVLTGILDVEGIFSVSLFCILTYSQLLSSCRV